MPRGEDKRSLSTSLSESHAKSYDQTLRTTRSSVDLTLQTRPLTELYSYLRVSAAMDRSNRLEGRKTRLKTSP